MKGEKKGMYAWKALFKVLIVASIILTANVAATTVSGGQIESSSSFPTPGPSVFVDPQVTYVFPGNSFTIHVRVFNLTDAFVADPDNPEYYIPLGNLYGFSLILEWDPTVLEYVSHTVTIPVDGINPWTGKGPFPDGVLHQPVFMVNDTAVQAAGIYELEYSSYFTAEAFNNPGADNSFFNMTFTALTIDYSSYLQLPIGKLELGDNEAPSKPIGRDSFGNPLYLYSLDGLVMVIIPGDIQGDTAGTPPDGDVDMFDFFAFADHYATVEGDPNYNVLADLQGDTGGSPPDGDVDMFDFFAFADNYGTSV